VRLVTQFSFIADPVIAWDKSIASINKLPIYIGLPGLAKATTLLKYAVDCGVGPSLAAFSKHAGQLTKLLTVSAPDEQLVALAKYKSENPQSKITGLHFFPFGGLKRTTDWLKKLAEGNFELSGEGGLNVAD
jgi:methylenetetrahydrofolate reductase (NADPH)